MQFVKRHLRRIAVVGSATLLLIVAKTAGSSEYPLISSLDNSDVLFRQIQSDISAFHRSSRTRSDPPALALFRYRLSEEDTFLRVASRLTLPHATIATLNGLTEAAFPPDADEILIPNQPGIFAPVSPESDLEYMISGRVPPEELELKSPHSVDTDPEMPTPEDPGDRRRRTVETEGTETVISHDGERKRFFFFPGEDFTASERRAFLGVLFRSPLDEYRITSVFGTRLSPFTGRPSFHTGIDMAASPGNPVRAVREAVVTDTGFDRVYGNYVILEHDEVFTSFYGHLLDIAVESGTEVRAGRIIGSVGNTGLSTGPHLHFEIRVRGEARDPVHFIPGSS